MTWKPYTHKFRNNLYEAISFYMEDNENVSFPPTWKTAWRSVHDLDKWEETLSNEDAEHIFSIAVIHNESCTICYPEGWDKDDD
jgi:hypothetical protein